MAMGIIYPPILPSTIPAFYNNVNSAIIKVPFTHNDLNVSTDMKIIYYKITTVTGEQKKNGSIEVINKDELGNNYVEIDISNDDKLMEYSYYKIYLSYDGKLYSNPTVGLYLGQANLTVQLSQSQKNPQIYIGQYNRDQALKEKEFSYQFILSNNSGIVIKDTGILYHDQTKDESNDQFYLDYEIPQDEIYILQYYVTTINQINLSTSITITNTMTNFNALQNYRFEFAPSEECCNPEDGTISIKIRPILLPESSTPFIVGSYKIQRSDENNPNIWRTITTFNLNLNMEQETFFNYITIFTDFSVASGVVYNYRIIQYNNYGCQSMAIGGIQQRSVTFEGNFLGDGERQLNVNFNPQMSSFKTNILQSKVETIGSKYPWINRNGIVNYKEFPLSGLISYHSDPNYLFISEEEAKSLQIYDYNRVRKQTPSGQEEHISNRTFNLSDINFKAEQYFKLKVLDFLNDGGIKLFRSATEGNYFVRIMNVSLAPQQVLGRMLHTFSCTAYEVEEINEKNIIPFFRLTKDFDETGLLQTNIANSSRSISNLKINEIFKQRGVFVTKRQKVYIKAIDVNGPPGAIIEFLLQKGNGEFNENNIKIVRKIIGLTGNLRIDMDHTPYYIIQIGMPYQTDDGDNYALVTSSLKMEKIENENGKTWNNFLSNQTINLVLHDWYIYEKPDFDCLKKIETLNLVMKAGIINKGVKEIIFNGSLNWSGNDQKKDILKNLYLLRLTNMLESEAKLKYYFGQWDKSQQGILKYPQPIDITIPGYSQILLWEPDLQMAIEQGNSWPEIICLQDNNQENENIKVQYEFISEQFTAFYSDDYGEVLTIQDDLNQS